MTTTCILEFEGSEKEILDVQATIVLERFYSNLVRKKLVLTNWCFFGIWSISRCIFEYFFLTRGVALFQQFADDAGSWIARSKTSRLPNQWKMTVPLDPCKKHQFEFPVDCIDVEMFPASPHDRDVMPKTRGVDVTEAWGTASFQKNRPKIRTSPTWQNKHVLAKVPVKNQFRRQSKPPAETTEQEHGVQKPMRLENS